MKKRFSEEQIIGFLKQADAGLAVKDLCRKHGFSETSYYLWRSKFGGMHVSDGRRAGRSQALVDVHLLDLHRHRAHAPVQPGRPADRPAFNDLRFLIRSLIPGQNGVTSAELADDQHPSGIPLRKTA